MGNNCMETQVQRTYTVEEIARILGISTRKAYPDADYLRPQLSRKRRAVYRDGCEAVNHTKTQKGVIAHE